MKLIKTTIVFVVLLIIMIIDQSSAQAVRCRSTQTIQMQVKEIVLKLLEQQANEVKTIKLMAG